MKRSEMVAWLTKMLNTYEDCVVDKTAANEILEGLESMGMAPPSIGMSGTDGYGDPVHIHEWGSEDGSSGS